MVKALDLGYVKLNLLPCLHEVILLEGKKGTDEPASQRGTNSPASLSGKASALFNLLLPTTLERFLLRGLMLSELLGNAGDG